MFNKSAERENVAESPVKINLQLFAEEATTETASTETSTETTTETGANNSETAEQNSVSFKDDPQNKAFAEMRRKAKEADDHKKKADEYEAKIKKLEKGLPEGYANIDEYLADLENDFTQQTKNTQPAKPTIDENKIVESILKRVEQMPVIQQTTKERQDRFLVESFVDVQKKFSDIKKAEDIPLDVWNAWDEGKSGRSLLSHLKEHRYDTDIENAKKLGANVTKANTMGAAHTTQVQGTKNTDHDDGITVPDEVKQQLMRNPTLRKAIEKDPNKLKQWYKNFHRE